MIISSLDFFKLLDVPDFHSAGHISQSIYADSNLITLKLEKHTAIPLCPIHPPQLCKWHRSKALEDPFFVESAWPSTTQYLTVKIHNILFSSWKIFHFKAGRDAHFNSTKLWLWQPHSWWASATGGVISISKLCFRWYYYHIVCSYYLINCVGMLEQAMAAVQECHSAETLQSVSL